MNQLLKQSVIAFVILSVLVVSFSYFSKDGADWLRLMVAAAVIALVYGVIRAWKAFGRISNDTVPAKATDDNGDADSGVDNVETGDPFFVNENETNDERDADWLLKQSPNFKQVMTYGNQRKGNQTSAIKQARSLTKKFPDFFLTWKWLASCLGANTPVYQLEKILIEGRNRCRCRFPLSQALASLETDDQNLFGALFWSIRAVCEGVAVGRPPEHYRSAVLNITEIAACLSITGIEEIQRSVGTQFESSYVKKLQTAQQFLPNERRRQMRNWLIRFKTEFLGESTKTPFGRIGTVVCHACSTSQAVLRAQQEWRFLSCAACGCESVTNPISKNSD